MNQMLNHHGEHREETREKIPLYFSVLSVYSVFSVVNPNLS